MTEMRGLMAAVGEGRTAGLISVRCAPLAGIPYFTSECELFTRDLVMYHIYYFPLLLRRKFAQQSL